MRSTVSFYKRNIKLFFKDKASLIMSLLAIIITILLFAVFLYDTNMPDDLINNPNGDYFMTSWLIAGMVAVASVTTTMGAFSVMVDDKVKKLYKDFYSAPVRRSGITAGYLMSAATVGVLMSFATVAAGEIYILIMGGKLLSFGTFMAVFGLVLLSSLSNTAILSFVLSFVKSNNVYSTLSILIGTLTGFISGLYLPIGILPAGVQYFMKLFPFTHSASLFRQLFMEGPLSLIFSGAPESVLAATEQKMGITLNLGSYTIPAWLSILFLVFTTVLFFALTVLNLSKKKK